MDMALDGFTTGVAAGSAWLLPSSSISPQMTMPDQFGSGILPPSSGPTSLDELLASTDNGAMLLSGSTSPLPLDYLNLDSDFDITDESLRNMLQSDTPALQSSMESTNTPELARLDGDSSQSKWLLMMHYFDHGFSLLFPHVCGTPRLTIKAGLLALMSHSNAFHLAAMAHSSDPVFTTADQLHQPAQSWTQTQQYCREAVERVEANHTRLCQPHVSLDTRTLLGTDSLVTLVHLILFGRENHFAEAINTAPRYTNGSLLELAADMIRLVPSRMGDGEHDNNLTDTTRDERAASRKFFEAIAAQLYIVADAANPGVEMNFLAPNLNARTSSPLLTSYVANMDSQDGEGTGTGAVFGLIALINDLVSWKGQAAATGTLSIYELGRRALNLQHKLDVNRKSLDTGKDQVHSTDDLGESYPVCSTGLMVPVVSCAWHDKVNRHVTALLTHAGVIYLHVALSGCIPKLSEIQESVSCATADLYELVRLRRGGILRSIGLTWALCVIGSMALEGEDESPGTRTWFITTLRKPSQLAGRGLEFQEVTLSIITKCWELLDAENPGEYVWKSALRALDLSPTQLV